MSVPMISILIVSYNVKHYLAQCLHSVWQSAKGIDVEVIVVDNDSSDGSREYIAHLFPASTYPQLTWVQSNENLGFGRANNLALSCAKGEYVLFLNPDTALTEQTLSDCLAFSQSHTDLGALGVRMLKDNGAFAPESRRGLPTPWVSFCKIVGLTSLFPRSKTFGRYYQSQTPVDAAAPIEVVSGAFMWVPRSVIQQVGGFDEQFFMYGEDIDLSYRISQSGRQNYYLPTPILHYKGESTQKDSLRYVQHFHRAMLLFYRKHFHSTHRALSLFVEAAIGLRAVLHKTTRMVRAGWRRLLPQQSDRPIGVVYVGSREGEVCALCDGRQMPFVSFDNPDAALAACQADRNLSRNHPLWVFDTADYTYASILHALAESDHSHYVGFYYPSVRGLIGGGIVCS